MVEGAENAYLIDYGMYSFRGLRAGPCEAGCLEYFVVSPIAAIYMEIRPKPCHRAYSRLHAALVFFPIAWRASNMQSNRSTISGGASACLEKSAWIEGACHQRVKYGVVECRLPCPGVLG